MSKGFFKFGRLKGVENLSYRGLQMLLVQSKSELPRLVG